MPHAERREDGRECPTCHSRGFAVSRLGPQRCEFCDGTFGGNPPTGEEVKEAQRHAAPSSTPSRVN
jgi:hypothetical protein